jgi:hypothetical protein
MSTMSRVHQMVQVRTVAMFLSATGLPMKPAARMRKRAITRGSWTANWKGRRLMIQRTGCRLESSNLRPWISLARVPEERRTLQSVRIAATARAPYRTEDGTPAMDAWQAGIVSFTRSSSRAGPFRPFAGS